MNALDVLLLAILGLAAVSGFRRGALLQVSAYGGLVVGLLLGALAAPGLARLTSDHATQTLIAVTVVLSAAAIGNAVGWLAGSLVRGRARTTRLGTADAAGGSVVAVVAVLLATWFLALTLVNGPLVGLASSIRSSAIVRTLDGALPPPPSVLAEARRFLDRVGFPEVFSGLPPVPSGPVRRPTEEEAHRAFAAAADSTVRIVGQACGGVEAGSGFVVADHYVLTNAHVVAGVADPFVQTRDGENQPATTVLYDPGTDVAVLRVANTPGPVLPLASGRLARGTGGAILGYPGGGDLVSEPAAVRTTIDAAGKDIYGRREVQRLVYELQAPVRSGDSGGPFVLPDGHVAGVVFAASTVDDGVGYALASAEVSPISRRVVGLTASVSTGSCVR